MLSALLERELDVRVLQRVDELGDQTLSKVKEKLPTVKKPSPELLNKGKDAAYAPVRHMTKVCNGMYQRTT
ncbi:hypothetical protein C7999DRAFT_36476 [Corynascus novoguineensis]|uniref:Uncharacterized protein n=1 Tax=Corynascus novoguineensis TaxID=1126955 RepID=A0AAN7HIA3_9PEZI|nr:hypothetical protein C7999DRAFT_36476 [Corynascus novoguineensis]